MYTSGTPTLHILLGAGHDHGPRKPISDRVAEISAIKKTSYKEDGLYDIRLKRAFYFSKLKVLLIIRNQNASVAI